MPIIVRGAGQGRALSRIMLLTAVVSLFVTVFIVQVVGTASIEQVPMLVPVSATVLSPEENFTLPARPAAFGPCFPGPGSNGNGGLTAEVYTVKGLGCGSENESKLEDSEGMKGKIALVMRGHCGFYEKVLHLQSLGAVGVLVGDNIYRRGLVTMYTSGQSDLATIPSAFVSRESYDIISRLKLVTVMSTPDTSPFINTVLFLLVSPLFSLSLVYGILVFHRRYKLMKDRAPKSLVDQLPTRVWYRDVPSSTIDEPRQVCNWDGQGTSSTGDSTLQGEPLIAGLTPRPEKAWISSGECIICLEEYVSGVSYVMRLPCGHEFHAECVSKWLICRKKTCPICKRDVTKASETTPLIKRNNGFVRP
jgi:hypothetical protein